MAVIVLECRTVPLSSHGCALQRVQPLAWSWEMAPHIFLSAAMNSGAITCLSLNSEWRRGKGVLCNPGDGDECFEYLEMAHVAKCVRIAKNSRDLRSEQS